MLQSRTHTCNELRSSNIGERVVLVGWYENIRKVSNAAGYEVLCATDKQFKKNKKLTLARSTSVTVKGLKAGKTYYVKVRAYRKDSTGAKVYGSYSKTVQIKIKK